uniref:SEFIR domain-containing protein n=1 Tax=Meloidogyne hapla TaxID=6305 RepID=A0A1I8BZH3_MELHA
MPDFDLPERSAGLGASVHNQFKTPHHPSGSLENALNQHLISPNCTKVANQFASKWTAGFRHIYVHSAARILQVEFVGAPPQFCFEQYEVRLLDETGQELLYSGIVSVDEMHKSGSIIFGTYNFTNLEYDKNYIPSVIPVERAADGRCLCPVSGKPYDATAVCSCVAADWHSVRMTRPDVLKLCPGCPSQNDTFALLSPPVNYENSLRDQSGGNSTLWILLLVLNCLFLLLIFLLIAAYLRCRIFGSAPYKNQFRRIRFIPNTTTTQQRNCLPQTNKGSPTSLAVCTNLTLGTVSTSCNSSLAVPLISGESDEIEEQKKREWPNLTLLIIYSHDSKLHEQSVLALAEFLRDRFGINVKLDRWETAQIDANLTDWLSSSVISADKVLVINSEGAWERYLAKINSHGQWALERNDKGLLDHIFLAHIDLALQHHSVVSTRFAYSKADKTLPLLQGRLQYILPDNISPLISALFGQNLRQDERLTSLSEYKQFIKLNECVKEMESFIEEKPNWFTSSHSKITTVVDDKEEKGRKEIEEEEKIKIEEKTIILENSEISEDEEISSEKRKDTIGESSGTTAKLDSGIFDWAGNDEEMANCSNNTKIMGELQKQSNNCSPHKLSLPLPIIGVKTFPESKNYNQHSDDSGILTGSLTNNLIDEQKRTIYLQNVS